MRCMSNITVTLPLRPSFSLSLPLSFLGEKILKPRGGGAEYRMIVFDRFAEGVALEILVFTDHGRFEMLQENPTEHRMLGFARVANGSFW